MSPEVRSQMAGYGRHPLYLWYMYVQQMEHETAGVQIDFIAFDSIHFHSIVFNIHSTNSTRKREQQALLGLEPFYWVQFIFMSFGSSANTTNLGSNLGIMVELTTMYPPLLVSVLSGLEAAIIEYRHKHHNGTHVYHKSHWNLSLKIKIILMGNNVLLWFI